MRITDVQTVLLTGPSSAGDSFLLQFRKSRSAAFVEIKTDTELVGIGETCVGYQIPEIVPSFVEFFKPILIGLTEDQINPRRVWQWMQKAGTFWTRNGAGIGVMAALEGALWDLLGKIHNVPVHQLLGGCLHDRLRCYATGAHSPHPWSEMNRKLDIYRDAGFNAAKLGVGWFDHKARERFHAPSVQAWVDCEAEKMEALRRHVGPDFGIALDAHMGNVDADKKAWDLATAKAVSDVLTPYDLLFLEEPLDYGDLEGYAELTRSTAVPIAGGEALGTREEFKPWARHRAVDLVQPDAAVTGIWAMLDIAAMFAVEGKRMAPHSWESGAAVMQNIHAAFACPNTSIIEVPPVPGGLLTEVYADGYRFEDGYLLPPEAPGLGVRLTDEVKSKYRFVPGSGEWNAVPGKPGIYL